jgi:hypothetical protein
MEENLFSELDKWKKKITFLKEYSNPEVKRDAVDSLEKLKNGHNHRLSKAEYYKKKYPGNPVCRLCGSVLVIRTNKNTNQEFWACSSYPTCKHTERLEAFNK